MTKQDTNEGESKALFLSPHRDDTAFSCGLLLSALMKCKVEITISNVFTTSDYAPYLPVDDTERVKQVSSKRRLEDIEFAATLERSPESNAEAISFLDLGWEDAPLRLKINTEKVLQAPVDTAEETQLVEQLRSMGFRDALVFAPLALGDHTDHLLVRDAARRAFPKADVVFYEDLPYACRLKHTATIPDTSLLPWLSPVVTAGTKRMHALCYRSQIAPEVAEEMEAYSASLGGRECFYAEPETFRRLESLLGS